MVRRVLSHAIDPVILCLTANNTESVAAMKIELLSSDAMWADVNHNSTENVVDLDVRYWLPKDGPPYRSGIHDGFWHGVNTP